MKGENQLLKAYSHKMRSCLHVSGEDAYSFLQSQFSNDLPKGEVPFERYGLWLNVKGRVLADSVIVHSKDEDYYIFSENTDASLIKEILENHIIADDVEIESIELSGSILVNTLGANVLCHKLGIPAREAKSETSNAVYQDLSVGLVFPSERLGENGFVFCFLDNANHDLAKEALEEASVHWIGANEMHLKRLALGAPLVPNEIGPNDLAGEGNLVPSAASLSKGCYLGQEVVARLYHVGKPQRQLFVMTFSALSESDSIELPMSISIEGRSLGELRTLYQDANDSNKWYGVALLKVRYLDLIESEFRLASHPLDSLSTLSEFSQNFE
jgi:folate-binding protein YgfZ